MYSKEQIEKAIDEIFSPYKEEIMGMPVEPSEEEQKELADKLKKDFFKILDNL